MEVGGGKSMRRRGASIVVVMGPVAGRRHGLPSAERKKHRCRETRNCMECGLMGLPDSVATVHRCGGRRWLRGKQEQQWGGRKEGRSREAG